MHVLETSNHAEQDPSILHNELIMGSTLTVVRSSIPT